MQLFHSFIKSINITCDPRLSIGIRNSMRLHQLHSPIDRLGSMRSRRTIQVLFLRIALALIVQNSEPHHRELVSYISQNATNFVPPIQTFYTVDRDFNFTEASHLMRRNDLYLLSNRCTVKLAPLHIRCYSRMGE